jgi:nucleotide-binding universal stress UspA family protein
MKVLVGVDTSQESHGALAYACHLLEHFDAQIHALYVQPSESVLIPDSFYAPFVLPQGLEKWIDAETLEVQEAATRECRYCLAGKVPCDPRVVEGDPADMLLEEAQSGQYDMIVLGSHGRSALKGFLLGTVHAKVLHHTTQPVLIVRDFRGINRVLVAYRGTECDQKALEYIAPLLARKKPQIDILHVEEAGRQGATEFAEQCLTVGTDTLRQLGHAPATKVRKGNFVDEVSREIAGSNYDLIVLGAYGHTRPRFLQLISDEALNIVRSTSRPVLVYRDKNAV